MKIKLIFLFLLLSFLSKAQKPTVIKTEKTTHNFGSIREVDGKVITTFNFKNTGKYPFVIEKVESSCGCTVAKYSKEAIKPRDKGYVKAIFDPKGYKGNFSKMIEVIGNTNNKLVFYVNGKVIPRPLTILDKYPYVSGNLRFKRKQVVLGNIFINKLDTVTVNIYNPSSKRITISYIKAPLHILPVITPLILESKSQTDFKFYYSAFRKNDIGFVFDRIYLMTDDNKEAEKELIIVAKIVQDFKNMSEEELGNTAKIKFNKMLHDFGNMNEGDIGKYEFSIKNEGNQKLAIYDIETTCGCTATALGSRKLMPGKSTKLKVVFHTKDRIGKQDKLITLKTNDPRNPEVVIHIKANIIPAEAE